MNVLTKIYGSTDLHDADVVVVAAAASANTAAAAAASAPAPAAIAAIPAQFNTVRNL